MQFVTLNSGNSSSTSNRKDGQRPFTVLFCHLRNILLCSSFRVLGIWEQIEFKHSQELDPWWGSSLGSNLGVRSCSRARPLPTLRHWSGKLKNALQYTFPYENLKNYLWNASKMVKISLKSTTNVGIFSSSIWNHGEEISWCEQRDLLQKKLNPKNNSKVFIHDFLWVLCFHVTILWRH